MYDMLAGSAFLEAKILVAPRASIYFGFDNILAFRYVFASELFKFIKKRFPKTPRHLGTIRHTKELRS